MAAALVKTLFLVMIISLTFSVVPADFVGAVELLKPSNPLAQGEVARIVLRGVTAGSRVQGFWMGEPLGFFQVGEGEFVALVGIDLTLPPGSYPLEVRLQGQEGRPTTVQETLKVAAKDYGVEHLRLPEDMVTLDAPTLKRVQREQARFRALWEKRSSKRYWKGPFIRPLPGNRISPFGRRRFINGERRSPHSGMDLKAAAGEPVRAANHGRVVLLGEFFFPGRSVVVDHGLGLYTMYFHLSEVKVAQGDLVKQGAVIGLAGATGRASGAHLHWGVRLQGARIDPVALLQATGG